MSLRAILSGSRVKKRPTTKKPLPPARQKSSAPSNTTAARPTARSASSTPPWPAGFRQTKPGASRGPAKNTGNEHRGEGGEEEEEEDEEEEDDFFDDENDKLIDSGLVASLADDLSLRDVVQALRYARASMFEPLPDQRVSAAAAAATASSSDTEAQPSPSSAAVRGGFVGNSTRVAELLNMRRRMPPLATTAHVAALLPNATATERETVTLVRAGVLCKVVQPQWRRGAAGTSNFFGGGGGGGGGGGSSRGGISERGAEGDRSDRRGSSRGSGDGGRLRRALAIGAESLGEVLVEVAALQQLVREGPSAQALSDDTQAAFVAWLGGGSGDEAGAAGATATAAADGRRVAFTISGRPAPQLTVLMVDELVRAGFLVGHGAATSRFGSINVVGHRSGSGGGGGGGGGPHRRGDEDRSGHSDTGDVFARPEDRTTLLSLETVARAASGSVEAVGGLGAVYTAGGGGARAGYHPRHQVTPVVPTEDLVLAVPGHGTFVKLVSAALAHLVGILARTPYRETLESTLRERWNAGGGGGGAGGGAGGHNHSVNRRGFRRVPLSRTKKWKDFYGLSFDWVLAEALGAGLVELFETGSVGRGVRLLM